MAELETVKWTRRALRTIGEACRAVKGELLDAWWWIVFGPCHRLRLSWLRRDRIADRAKCKTSVTSKFLCIVVKFVAGGSFIITAYYTDTIKRGESLWQS